MKSFLALFFLFCTLHGTAQEEKSFRPELGFCIQKMHEGDQLSSFNYLDLATPDNWPGWGMELLFDFRAEKKLGVLSGLQFIKTRQKDVGDDEVAVNCNLDVPILFRYYVGEKVQFFGEAGGFFRWNFYRRRIGTDRGFIRTGPPNQPGGGYWKDFPYDTRTWVDINDGLSCGPAFGLGLRIPVQEDFFLIKLTYKIGFNAYDDLAGITFAYGF